MCEPIKYFLCLLELEDNRLPKLCHTLMLDMSNHGRLNWCPKVKGLLFLYGFGDESLFICMFKQRLRDGQSWWEYISN